MHWVYLILAIIFETIGTAQLKISNGFSVLLPSICTVVSYILCFIFLSFALKTMEISVAYAIWCVFGILLVSIVGIVFFDQSISLIKIVSILLIIARTIGLRLAH